jgi:hypothetical protein
MNQFNASKLEFLSMQVVMYDVHVILRVARCYAVFSLPLRTHGVVMMPGFVIERKSRPVHLCLDTVKLKKKKKT